MELSENNDIEKQISDLYEKFLSRKPATLEIDYWKNQISLGQVKFEELASKIEGSKESYLLKIKNSKILSEDKNFTLIILDNHKFYLYPHDTVSIDNYTNSDSYDAGTTTLLKKLLKKRMNVINIGANIGYFALLAARQVGPEGKVFAFEPFENTVKLLKKNIEANQYRNIEAIAMAVSNKTGMANLSTGGSSLHNLISFKEIKEMKEVTVLVTTIDDFLEKKQTRIDFIIIDAEGSEQFILEGMKKTLEKNDSLEIIVEFNPFTLELAGTNAESFLNTIESYKFSTFIIDENNNEIKLIDKSKLIKEIIPPKITNLYLTRKTHTS